MESERYLITVEEAKAVGSRAVEPDGSREALESGPRTLVSSSRSLGCQPSGLKRKATVRFYVGTNISMYSYKEVIFKTSKFLLWVAVKMVLHCLLRNTKVNPN